VWREAEDGQRIVFDPIFSKETRLPRAGEPALVVGRRYHPVHNVGRFRYLECSALRNQIEPAGDILAWQEILFPYTAALAGHRNLKTVRIQHDPAVASHMIEEVYRCDANGVVEVTIANRSTGYAKTFRVREAGAAADATQARNKGKGRDA
jgi:hypothetical protein